MQPALLAAAALLAFVGIAHSVLGERFILVRLLRRHDLPKLFGSDWFTRRTLRFAWHITSLAWLGFAGVLLAVATPPPGDAGRDVLQVVSLTFLASALLTAGASRGRHLAWIVFLAIAALCWGAA